MTDRSEISTAEDGIVKKVLEMIATKGDVAAAALGAAGGMLLESVFFAHSGVSLGDAAAIGMTGLFGLKQGLQSVWPTSPEPKTDPPPPLADRAQRLQRILRQDTKSPAWLLDHLNRDVDYWTGSLITDEQLEKAIAETVNELRSPQTVVAGVQTETVTASPRDGD